MAMDIIFNPPTNHENQYIRLMVEELVKKGYRVNALDGIFSNYRHFKSIKIVHLNWFENIDERNVFVAIKSFFRKFAVLAVIRVSGKPLVWTMHNRISHEKGVAFFSRILVRLLERWAHRIVVHSRQSEAILSALNRDVVKKTVYIPHPNYIDVYGHISPRTNSAGLPLRLLFVGMIKPYKNIELLIDVVKRFGPRVKLTLAGKAVSPSYGSQIRRKVVRAGNAELLPQFIPDREVPKLFAKADVVVLPYDLSSSLNSGTAFLAFSYKKTVICPEIGTITDLDGYKKYVFHYRYDTSSEHEKALTHQIEAALLLKQNEPEHLDLMGNRLRDYVALKHDNEQIGASLNELYKRLINQRN